jgi:hypothetical protein
VVKLTVVTKGGGGTENTAAVKGENVKASFSPYPLSVN